MTSTLDARDTMRRAAGAMHTARKLLCERHCEEYDQIHGDLRVQMGLPREYAQNKALTIQARIEKLERKLLDLRAKKASL